jgi:hypothetical protein
MPIFLGIVAVVLHLWLGWPVWVSVLVAFGGQTILGLISAIATAGRMLPASIFLQAIGGALIGMVLAYIPMVIVFYFTGHPSW